MSYSLMPLAITCELTASWQVRNLLLLNLLGDAREGSANRYGFLRMLRPPPRLYL